MKNKPSRSKKESHQRGAHRCVAAVSALVLAFGVVGVTSCGRNSQAEEDEANLKLVGYELDQVGFFKAVGNDDLQALKIFKDRQFDLNQRNLKGESAVYEAADSGSVRALHFLVKNGADIETVDENGVSPLMAGANAGHGEVISYLLEKGANVRLKDEVGKFALIHALDGESPEAIHLLAPESRDLLDTGLLYAADMDKHETIPLLVKYGASVYARNGGKTSLMIAAERGNERAAQALLAEGANLYAVSDDGKLAKDFAEGNERVLAVLVDSETSADVDSLALEWSDDELEALVQKAMDRSPQTSEVVSNRDVVATGVVASVGVVASEGVATSGGVVADDRGASVAGTGSSFSSNVAPSSSGGVVAGVTAGGGVVVERIRGKNLSLELNDAMDVNDVVTMAAYAEKSLPIQVRADDVGRVEVYDLRESEESRNVDPVVTEGSQIGMTGLRVKQIKKKMVNNKLTGGNDRELVTLMIEDEQTGMSRELYAGYESQAAEAVAVLKINDTGEHLVVERNDEFYDLKGVAYEVMDVNDEEMIIENISTGKLTMLPLMGVKK